MAALKNGHQKMSPKTLGRNEEVVGRLNARDQRQLTTPELSAIPTGVVDTSSDKDQNTSVAEERLLWLTARRRELKSSRSPFIRVLIDERQSRPFTWEGTIPDSEHILAASISSGPTEVRVIS